MFVVNIMFHQDDNKLGEMPNDAPELYSLLQEREAQLHEGGWDGSVSTLPSDTRPYLVRASGKMGCTPQELGKRCAELGCLAYAGDAVLLEDGTYSHDQLVAKTDEFLERVHDSNKRFAEKFQAAIAKMEEEATHYVNQISDCVIVVGRKKENELSAQDLKSIVPLVVGLAEVAGDNEIVSFTATTNTLEGVGSYTQFFIIVVEPPQP